MIQQKGFTLIEWLIYFFLIISVLTGVFHFAASVQQKFFALSKRSGTLSQLCAAQDAIAHDVGSAPVESELWDVIGPSSVAWKHKNKKISWFLKKNILRRVEKEFDCDLKKWKAKKTSIVARDVSELNFAPHYLLSPRGKRHVQSITSILGQFIEGKLQQIERTIILKNRVVG